MTAPSPTTARRRARERALELLYEAEIKGMDGLEVLAAQAIRPEEYAEVLVKGVTAHRSRLDTLIADRSKGWALSRMPLVDVTLLRIGAFELAHRPDVPTAAVLAEAVELAGQYSTEESSRFVNGLLSALARELRAN